MKPYSIRSLYRFRAVRRLVYGRGNGVHSPLAFGWINSIVRPRANYYMAKEVARISGQVTWGALWYRLIARNHVTGCKYFVESSEEEAIAKALFHLATGGGNFKGAPSVMGLEPIEVVLSDSIERVKHIALNQGTGNAVFLLLNVRGDSDREAYFIRLTQELKAGIVIDLFEHALVINMSGIGLYLYRSTLLMDLINQQTQ